jgi:succinylglutamic semialdehyde dehydrogenase
MNHWDFIAGQVEQPAVADEEFTMLSPADQSDVIGHYRVSKAQVDKAVDAATQAFKGWRKLSLSTRVDSLKRYQAALKANADALALSISREIGKPLWEAKTEVSAMVTKVDLTINEGLAFTQDKVLADLPGEIRHRPLGVVAVVGPFNFPGHLPNGQIVPALLLGNTVVFKPSEKGGHTAGLMAQCAQQAGFPPGVFNVVQGARSVAQHLTGHPGIAAILFTGSLDVGKAILRANAERPGVLVALELGGKNASVVLEDCDLERTAREIVFSAFATAGQRCTATSRVIALKAIADALMARVVQLTERLTVGFHQTPDTFLGPVISESARQRVIASTRDAAASGARPLLQGGPVDVPGHVGFYLRPSIHRLPAGVHHLKGYTDTELFGPDLCMVTADSLEEAASIANQTPFGLSAAIFTASETKFEALATELDVGVVHMNRSTAGASGRLPFGGIKDSGNHRAAGILMGQSCTFAQGLLRSPPASTPLPTWPGMTV